MPNAFELVKHPHNTLSCAYFISAILSFLWQMGYFNEKVGPLGLAIIVIVCLTAILISAVKDVLLSKK